MSVTVSLSDQDVFTALRAFLVAVLPTNTEVVQAQDNGVPMPLGGFVAMNNIGQRRLATNQVTYTPGTANPGIQASETDTEYTMQIDFYGTNASGWATIVQTLFRDQYGTSLFPANIQPLYADDPIQIPLINGEEQYEQRWRMKAVMQFNPVVSVPQDFAVSLTVTPADVDVSFPP